MILIALKFTTIVMSKWHHNNKIISCFLLSLKNQKVESSKTAIYVNTENL